jgi:hypothetical protein
MRSSTSSNRHRQLGSGCMGVDCAMAGPYVYCLCCCIGCGADGCAVPNGEEAARQVVGQPACKPAIRAHGGIIPAWPRRVRGREPVVPCHAAGCPWRYTARKDRRPHGHKHRSAVGHRRSAHARVTQPASTRAIQPTSACVTQPAGVRRGTANRSRHRHRSRSALKALHTWRDRGAARHRSCLLVLQLAHCVHDCGSLSPPRRRNTPPIG